MGGVPALLLKMPDSALADLDLAVFLAALCEELEQTVVPSELGEAIEQWDRVTGRASHQV
jgi:hypothetical protein